MLRAWRIVKSRYLSRAFDGDGARRYGGRWNSPGRSVVYLSETRALATLEVLTGLQSTAPIPAYVLVGAEFPAALVIEAEESILRKGWDTSPPTSISQAVGDGWLDRAESAVLRVPSVVVSNEFNFLINPSHPDFRHIRIGHPEPLLLDPGLLSR